ncbi:MAG TPA: polysaccharide deacetylase family protein [Epulopiscium sp.]|nr:polysaccharide deacetylase family protein [Candidatus Epulonipiscium sp.]
MSIVTQMIKSAKSVKRLLKGKIQSNKPIYMSSVRRIEQVKTKERVCAMTFDDGPFNLPPSNSKTDKPLTLVLLETLEKHGAAGTFDIIGDTSGSYPDIAGQHGSASWGGVKYDHYPDINKDSFGGAIHCNDLVQRTIDGGHELANHGYVHILFGKKPFVYGKRAYLKDINAVVDDLQKLHNYVKEKFNYEMKLSRPPHYVDSIAGGHSSYDAYHEMDYQYMAASFDGAGWLPCATYEEEVEATYKPMEKLLEQDPDALCGQIIFQKDGYNMARRTPVADGLAKQLEILSKYGYKVVSVSDLRTYSEFTDVGSEDSSYKDATLLLDEGYCIAFKDNTLKLDAPLQRGEFAFMLFGKEGTSVRTQMMKQDPRGKVCSDVKINHPYSGAIKLGTEKGCFELNSKGFKSSEHISLKEFNDICGRYFENFKSIEGEDVSIMTHKATIKILARNIRA